MHYHHPLKTQYYNCDPYLSMGHTNRLARYKIQSSGDNKCIQDDHSMTYIKTATLNTKKVTEGYTKMDPRETACLRG